MSINLVILRKIVNFEVDNQRLRKIQKVTKNCRLNDFSKFLQMWWSSFLVRRCIKCSISVVFLFRLSTGVVVLNPSKIAVSSVALCHSERYFIIEIITRLDLFLVNDQLAISIRINPSRSCGCVFLFQGQTVRRCTFLSH